MPHFQAVAHAFHVAWSRRAFIFTVYILLQILAYALIAPGVGALVNLAVSVSDQTALTDQDIALFMLTPGGFVMGLGVASTLLLAEVFGFTVMAAVLRQDQRGLSAVRTALGLIVTRLRALLTFAVLFVLRVLALALPFLVGTMLVAMWYLTEFDINYYLTFRPPEFKWAVALIAVIVLAMAVALLARLSGWALALHLVLFADMPPRAAFAASAQRMQGRKRRLQIELVIWVGLRIGALVLLSTLAGLVLNLIPLHPGAGLRLALVLTAAVALGWTVLGFLVSALSLGALAALIDGFLDGPRLHPDAAQDRIPGALRGRLVLVSVGLVVFVLTGFWSGGQLLDRVQSTDRVEIIGHRGAAGSRPENTMASVVKAIEDGADWVEIDVQETADGEIVVMHDSDFMKMAQVPLKIWDATMQDIAQIDIGSWYDPAYADQRAPLLRDVLLAAKGTPSKVLIELKYYGHDVDLENRVIAIVEELDMQDHIATMSLKYPAVLKMQELRPSWPAGVLAATAVGDLAGLQGDFVAVNTGIARARLINAVQASGKDIYVWTVNDPLEMSRMISRGVDGLITDEPALARQVIEVRAGLSTPERLILWLSQILGLDMDAGEYQDARP